MSRRKPVQGVCGRCGCAVVRGAVVANGWSDPPSPPSGTFVCFYYANDLAFGHRYEDWRLVEVRCLDCRKVQP